MKLNRYNYEEYFILYLDNELDSESRREVEAFAQENPDLKAELDMLMQSKLTPDADISFTDKGSLLRFDSSSSSLANYEEWLTSYIDNELTAEERTDVERFVAANPSVQKELSLLQQTKLQPETIVFPYKEFLYHKEEKARVIPIRWWRIAAAAVLLLAISTTAIVLINNKKGNDNGRLAKTQSKNEKVVNDTVLKQSPNEPTTKQQNLLVSDKKKNEPKETKQADYTIVVKQNNKPGEKKERRTPEKNDESFIANNTNDKKEKQSSNNLTTPDNNPNVTGKGNTAGLITEPENHSPEILTGPGKITDKAVVTTSGLQPSELPEQPSGNKGLRGFLRKVTRTFEKRTNIKATDDDDRLLIAGLAIKMN